MTLRPFHAAYPVKDIIKAKTFYKEVLGCEEGRSDTTWVDFDFFGHQEVFHEVETAQETPTNPVDGKTVPIPHFGVVLTMSEWKSLADRLKNQNIQFEIEPYIRFEGQPGEQATMFFPDPSGNYLEFKSFKDPSQLFAKELKS